ncbi:MAG TPA: hypothetical protein VGM46_00195 [Mesorhizobium sp.]
MKPDVYPKALPWLAGAVILFGIGLLLGWYYQFYPELRAETFDENGPVETLEMVALIAAAIIFAFRAVRSNDPIGTMCIPIVLILAIAFVRETPRCDSSFYDGGLCFRTERWKDVTVTLFLIAAAIALFRRRQHLAAVLSIRKIHVFWPIWLSAVLLILAEIGEAHGVLGTEESLEFFAYLYLASLGVWIHRNT